MYTGSTSAKRRYTGRHEQFLEVYDALIKLGDTVLIQHKPSGGWGPEVVDLAMARNFNASELAYARQEHDMHGAAEQEDAVDDAQFP